MKRNRAGIILLENNALAVIKRIKENSTYFVIPGGGIESGESARKAAVREAKEELGIKVHELTKAIEFKQNGTHTYFFVGKYTGIVGTGTGEEFEVNNGTYIPCWIPVDELDDKVLYPEEVKKYVSQQYGGNKT